MLKILLAFDHEIPLGGINSTYDDAIFNPTDRIIESANKHGFKINLFTDILCASAFKKNKINEFYSKYTLQLHKALLTGHDVQLHIHPHWVDTQFDNESFKPSVSFRLADFANKPYPYNIEGIIETAIEELKFVCLKAKPDYICNSYRAGGYNLSPETERILTSLYKNGIRIDSSIVKGFYYKSALTEINFKNFHFEGNWKIPLSGPIEDISKEGLFEVPIASKPAGMMTNIKHLYFKILYRKHGYSSGKPIHSGNVKKIDKLKFLFSTRPLGFDIISLKPKDLVNILSCYINSQKYTEDIIVSTVSHPKNMGQYSVQLMEEFVKRVKDKYPDVEFCTFTDIYNKIILKRFENTL